MPTSACVENKSFIQIFPDVTYRPAAFQNDMIDAQARELARRRNAGRASSDDDRACSVWHVLRIVGPPYNVFKYSISARLFSLV